MPVAPLLLAALLTVGIAVIAVPILYEAWEESKERREEEQEMSNAYCVRNSYTTSIDENSIRKRRQFPLNKDADDSRSLDVMITNKSGFNSFNSTNSSGKEDSSRASNNDNFLPSLTPALGRSRSGSSTSTVSLLSTGLLEEDWTFDSKGGKNEGGQERRE